MRIPHETCITLSCRTCMLKRIPERYAIHHRRRRRPFISSASGFRGFYGKVKNSHRPPSQGGHESRAIRVRVGAHCRARPLRNEDSMLQNAKLLRSYSRPLVGLIHPVSRHRPCSSIRRLYHRSGNNGGGNNGNLSGVTSLPEKFRRAIDFPETFTDAGAVAGKIERER